MESRLFQALKAFKGAEGCEANLFEEFKKIAEAAFFSGYFLINGGCKDEYKLKMIVRNWIVCIMVFST